MISSRASRSVRFFYNDRVGRHHFAREDQVALIGDGPFDILGFGKIHCLSNGGREVDVPLLAFLALDDLHFSWIAHLVSSYITRYPVKPFIV